MSGPTRRHDGGRDPARFLTLLDAIVAIATTLLVLPLVDVAVDADRTEPVTTLLHDNLGLLGSFALSFAVIMNFWRAHHRIFEDVAVLDPTLRLGSELWVFTVALLPFPTRLIAVYPSSDRAVIAVYVGVLLVSSATLSLLHHHVRRTPAVRVPGSEPGGREWVFTSPVVIAVALALGLLVPAVGYRWLGLLVVVPLALRVLDRLRRD